MFVGSGRTTMYACYVGWVIAGAHTRCSNYSTDPFTSMIYDRIVPTLGGGEYCNSTVFLTTVRRCGND